MKELKTLSKTYKAFVDGVLIIDNKDQIVFANKKAKNQLLEDPINKKLPQIFLELKVVNNDNKKIELSEKLLNKIKSGQSQIIGISKNKGYTWYKIKINKIKLNKKPHTIFYFQDVSDYISEEKRMLTALGTINHEIKNILANIKAFNELIQVKIKGSTKKELTKTKSYSKKIEANVNLLTKLVNDLMDASKVKLGELKLNKEKVNLDHMITDLVEVLNHTYKTHKISLQGETNSSVHLDPARIKRVLINLISNAVKYSPNNNKVIIKVEKSENKIKISIKDKGVGIPLKDQKEIFKPYYRAHKEQFKGSGVGLYIAERIISKHNGKIWVESKKNKGTTIVFTLPFKKTKDPT